MKGVKSATGFAQLDFKPKFKYFKYCYVDSFLENFIIVVFIFTNEGLAMLCGLNFLNTFKNCSDLIFIQSKKSRIFLFSNFSFPISA